jgi:hypothetical protein
MYPFFLLTYNKIILLIQLILTLTFSTMNKRFLLLASILLLLVTMVHAQVSTISGL